MIILITEVEDRGPTDVVIRFESDLGGGLGIWKSRNVPKKLNSYDVELYVGDLVWMENVFVSEDKVTLIQPDDANYMKIQGKIEKVEDSGDRCFMYLGSTLFVFSCQGIPSSYRGYVSILTRTIEVFDTGVIRY